MSQPELDATEGALELEAPANEEVLECTVTSIEASIVVDQQKPPDNPEESTAHVLERSGSIEVVEDSANDSLSESILYRVRWSDRYDNLVKTFESGKPFPGFHSLGAAPDFEGRKIISDGGVPEKPVLEIVKDIIGTAGVGPDESVKTVTDIAVNTIKSSKIVVQSQPLLRLLDAIIDYYPDQALSGTSVSFVEPYPALMHYYHELKAIATAGIIQDETGNIVDSVVNNEEAHAHLAVLLAYLEPHVARTLFRLEAQFAQENPVIAFDDLWYIYKPGTDVYVVPSLRRTGSDTAKVVIGMSLETDPAPIFYTGDIAVKALVLHTFNLESDGQKISRQRESINIDFYKGERAIANLLAYPASLIDRKDGGLKRHSMESDGNLCWELIRAGHVHMRYSGVPWPPGGEEPGSLPAESGGLVVDILSHVRYGDGDNDLTNWYWLNNAIRPVKDKWESYTDISVRDTVELTPHQYFLLVKCLPGFVTKDKTWHIFGVEQLTSYGPEPRAMKSLILKSEHLDIIRAVCDARVSSWKIDFIESKGEGSIILLHGPPGVGKTFTVEAFAQEANRPLLQLTIADIGLEDDAIEARLTKWFNLAEAWNAILLLDEADIFMEQRSQGQIQRNALVSVFLRLMEYFRGVFFLTTNRIGNIDDAFLSRVYVVIGYDELDDAKREQIWRGFLAKLSEDMANKKKEGSTDPVVEVDHYATQYVLNDEKIRQLRWNGREIRNALSTAIALARFQTFRDPSRSRPGYIDVSREHFQSVVNMSKSFKDYLQSITGRDEHGRAYGRQDRNDNTKSVSPTT